MVQKGKTGQKREDQCEQRRLLTTRFEKPKGGLRLKKKGVERKTEIKIKRKKEIYSLWSHS